MKKNSILFIIVFSQFLCTSLWFAGNAIVDELIAVLSFPESSIGHLTSAIQFGFITGTLFYAFLSIADRFSPSKVFFVSALLGALANIIMIMPGLNFTFALGSRFLTGFFLAGIYPVGMKIAADHFDKSLGKSLGFLVGALVIGTAFPHLMKDLLSDYPFQYVIFSTSILALLGGLLILSLVPDGPYRKVSQKLKISKTFTAFKFPSFKAAAFGYFGHMWELYAFYAFLPLMIKYFNSHTEHNLNISLWSFLIIASGGLGCFITGYLSRKNMPKNLATWALSTSGIMCVLSPLLFLVGSPYLFLILLIIWGTSIAADSPMFSTLVANNAIPEYKGTALTIVNCIGFAITIISIQLLNLLSTNWDFRYQFLFLAIGPLFGLASLWVIKVKVT